MGRLIRVASAMGAAALVSAAAGGPAAGGPAAGATAPATTFVQVATGWWHNCAVTTAGAAKCWGSNFYGELGDGTITDRSVPVTVTGLGSGVRSVAVGYYYSCALLTSGTVNCWGLNGSGQLGIGTRLGTRRPVPVKRLGTVRRISAGYPHTCAVTTGGAAKCWGGNAGGQVGDGTRRDRLTPVDVSGLGSGVTEIATGSGHSCAIVVDRLRCWGSNEFGQLGDGTTTDRLTPVAVGGASSSARAIRSSQFHNCSTTLTGTMACWGDNDWGQLGTGDVRARRFPTPVTGLGTGRPTAIAAGVQSSCAVASGAVRCWGANDFGQLGDGTRIPRLAPTPVLGISRGGAQVGAGARHACALLTSGRIKCWGDNGLGQLGNGTTIDSLTPVLVAG